MKSLYLPFVYVLVGMVAAAATIRLAWELLSPALLPMSLLLLAATVLWAVLRWGRQ